MHTYVSSRVRAAFIYFHFEFFKLQRSRSKSLIDLNGRQYSVNSKFGNTFYLNLNLRDQTNRIFMHFMTELRPKRNFEILLPCIVIVMVYK